MDQYYFCVVLTLKSCSYYSCIRSCRGLSEKDETKNDLWPANKNLGSRHLEGRTSHDKAGTIRTGVIEEDRVRFVVLFVDVRFLNVTHVYDYNVPTSIQA